jgi:threonine/homoserine/homoserine lactone efflux protein
MGNIVALILATLVLVMIPGPNAAIIVAKSVQQGFRAGFVATLGTTTGVAVQLLLMAMGVAVLIEKVASALTIVKWIGVVYLIWLGIRTWKAAGSRALVDEAPSTSANFSHGFAVAVLNPKTLLFNVAFLPQFIGGGGSVGAQMLVLSSVYLVVLLAGDLVWATIAASARPWLKKHAQFGRRVTAGFLVGAGIGLALSRKTF